MPSDNVVIDLQGVTKRYGAFTAVNGVDLQVRSGALFGLIGHNGAGKSTLFKMMLGLIAPDAGDIRITGTPVRDRAFRAVRRRIGYLPETPPLYPEMTVRRLLEYAGRLHGVARDRIAARVDVIVGLRVNVETEREGLDVTEHTERAYNM